MNEPKINIPALIVKTVVGYIIMISLLFLPAGRLDWLNGWLLIGIIFIFQLAIFVFLMPKNPGLVAERMQKKEGTKGWDKVVTSIASIFIFAAFILCGLDERFGWSSYFNFKLQMIAVMSGSLGIGIFYWSMSSNKFFSNVVRIQSDREHSVATGGPYKYVRHPGYVGWMVFGFSIPVMLDSVWAVIPMLLTAVMMVFRTFLEDKTLHEELKGYTDYAARVRYKLIPGVW